MIVKFGALTSEKEVHTEPVSANPRPLARRIPPHTFSQIGEQGIGQSWEGVVGSAGGGGGAGRGGGVRRAGTAP